MQRSRSFADDIARAVAAVSAAEDFEDLDKATSNAVEALAKSQSEIDPTALQIESLLGCGGYGSVWRCKDGKSDDQLALKMMRKCLLVKLPASGTSAPQRALQEKTALEELRHPFISWLRGAFQDEASLYLILELATGGDLFTLMKSLPDAVPEEWCRFYTASIALALRHMHNNNYVYRDMKPENVLLDGEGYIRLADLGFAKKVDSKRTFTACGTEQYVPPELLAGQGRTAAADWWGLGVLMHEMLTGRPPFDGDSSADVFNSIREYTQGGGSANSELRMSVEACNATTHCALFLSGLLIGDEKGRLGSGPEGFTSIQVHKWFGEIETEEWGTPMTWGGLLRREIKPPYLPRPLAPEDVEELDPEVMEDVPVDEKWVAFFAPFGPSIKTDFTFPDA